MRNMKLTLEYDGTEFRGFQRQRELRTVQGVLEGRFSRLLREQVKIVGAGRTDAGVHAIGQVASFHTRRPLVVGRMAAVLNATLPADVKVQACEDVEDGFHARRCAVSRTYRYTVIERPMPSPLLGRFALIVSARLDVAAMDLAARELLGRHDFRAFQASGSETLTTERNVLRCECRRRAEKVEIVVEADSFLYRMVRNMAAALIEVGRGRLSPGEPAEAVARGQRIPKLPPAPACGLCLVKVSY